MAYVFIPIVQRELDDFREVVWNNKKGRKQPKKALPNGKSPKLIYEFPEACEGEYNDFAIRLDDDDSESLSDLEARVRGGCGKLYSRRTDGNP